ncbi:MAG: hypothetical protein MUF01_10805 [Bryobacterales bacterium]|nr:hypothetical protein [Bryobacterales bacterium]
MPAEWNRQPLNARETPNAGDLDAPGVSSPESVSNPDADAAARPLELALSALARHCEAVSPEAALGERILRAAELGQNRDDAATCGQGAPGGRGGEGGRVGEGGQGGEIRSPLRWGFGFQAAAGVAVLGLLLLAVWGSTERWMAAPVPAPVIRQAPVVSQAPVVRQDPVVSQDPVAAVAMADPEVVKQTPVAQPPAPRAAEGRPSGGVRQRPIPASREATSPVVAAGNRQQQQTAMPPMRWPTEVLAAAQQMAEAERGMADDVSGSSAAGALPLDLPLETVRVRMDADALWRMGLSVTPPAPNQEVLADFLVSGEGRPLAVRLLGVYP